MASFDRKFKEKDRNSVYRQYFKVAAFAYLADFFSYFTNNGAFAKIQNTSSYDI
jgi:hypothetical protein